MRAAISPLAAIYSALAEVLVSKRQEDLPLWIASPGREWPLFGYILELAGGESASSLSHIAKNFEKVIENSLPKRWEGFEVVFYSKNSSPIWMYESQYVNGRTPGPITFEIQSLYKQTGLEIIGPELPDHISMELSFLAHLSQNELDKTDDRSLWKEARRLFIKKHAAKWMPQIGQKLTKINDPAWKALGHLLITVIEGEYSESAVNHVRRGFPSILDKENCSLCGFCIRVCPTKALHIIEDEATTALWFRTTDCTQCGKCEQICPEEVIWLQNGDDESEPYILRESPRVTCKHCNQLMTSQAELDYAAVQLNNPPWLQLCPECRIVYMNRG